MPVIATKDLTKVEAKIKECKTILRDLKTIIASEMEFCRKLKIMAGTTLLHQTSTRHSPAPDDYTEVSRKAQLNLIS
jgi:hypothetical protein